MTTEQTLQRTHPTSLIHSSNRHSSLNRQLIRQSCRKSTAERKISFRVAALTARCFRTLSGAWMAPFNTPTLLQAAAKARLIWGTNLRVATVTGRNHTASQPRARRLGMNR